MCFLLEVAGFRVSRFGDVNYHKKEVILVIWLHLLKRASRHSKNILGSSAKYRFGMIMNFACCKALPTNNFGSCCN